jgi:hypothetical protein
MREIWSLLTLAATVLKERRQTSASVFVFSVRFGAVRCFEGADHPWWFLPRGLGFCRLMVGIFSVLIFTLNNYCSAKVNFGKSPAGGSLVIIWLSLRLGCAATK